MTIDHAAADLRTGEDVGASEYLIDCIDRRQLLEAGSIRKIDVADIDAPCIGRYEMRAHLEFDAEHEPVQPLLATE